MKAWLFQDHRQKEKLGEDDAPWSVGWYDPDGKKKSKRLGSHSAAVKYARKIEGQLAAGTYQNVSRKNWEQFVDVYESRVLAIAEPGTREATQQALTHFARLMKPTTMRAITSGMVSDYVAKRRLEKRGRDVVKKLAKGKKEHAQISPATVNKELRALKAVFRKAHRWGYLARVPEFEFLREAEKLPSYVPPEHFTKLYDACEAAKAPSNQPYPPADWWRALLVMAYMTGWRIGSLLDLRREDVDLAAATALSRAEHNKGRRDQQIGLHPLVIQHLSKLAGFSRQLFPWTTDRRQLYNEFRRIQKAAGVKPTGKAAYGFHDLRRSFATMNVDRMEGEALQALMQHRDYKTTQRYINIARQLKPAVANLYVPELKIAETG
jgi:integrase